MLCTQKSSVSSWKKRNSKLLRNEAKRINKHSLDYSNFTKINKARKQQQREELSKFEASKKLEVEILIPRLNVQSSTVYRTRDNLRMRYFVPPILSSHNLDSDACAERLSSSTIELVLKLTYFGSVSNMFGNRLRWFFAVFCV